MKRGESRREGEESGGALHSARATCLPELSPLFSGLFSSLIALASALLPPRAVRAGDSFRERERERESESASERERAIGRE